MSELTPEQRARQQIDAQLVACGWIIQNYAAADFSAGRGIALREVPLKTGPCDYLPLVAFDRSAHCERHQNHFESVQYDICDADI
jgi:hypothetical protein